jgi:rare lipoprotein A
VAGGTVDAGAPVHLGGPLELMDLRTTVLAPLAVVAAFHVVGSALGQGSDDATVFEEEGQASYYGKRFHGRPTASGEPFDQDAITAAHPELPLGAEVRIEATKRQVEEATDGSEEVPKVERQLEDARRAAAAEGTPQPRARRSPSRCPPWSRRLGPRGSDPEPSGIEPFAYDGWPRPFARARTDAARS